jgi:hypothetical protein
MKRMYCTISTRSHLFKVYALFESLCEQHDQNAHFAVLLSDDVVQTSNNMRYYTSYRSTLKELNMQRRSAKSIPPGATS